MERYLRSGEFRNVLYDNGILTSTIVLSDVDEGGVWGRGGGGGVDLASNLTQYDQLFIP